VNCIKKTLLHKMEVGRLLALCVKELAERASKHDDSKLGDEEFDVFAEYTLKLWQMTYGSDEYKECMKRMEPALQHHYLINRHHPEHFVNGISGMSLIDLLEMFCDWMAATKRHEDGNMMNSIKQNQERFEYSDEIKAILINTYAQVKKLENNG